MRSRYLALPVFALLLTASSCLTQARRDEIFADGIESAFIETKMAEQYRAYVTADQTLGENERGKRLNWVTRVEALIGEHGDGVVAAVKVHMITNGICAQYDAYVDADPALGDQSKYIRKRSATQVRKLIATAEGS